MAHLYQLFSLHEEGNLDKVMKVVVRLILLATNPSHVTFAALSQILLYKPKENICMIDDTLMNRLYYNLFEST